MRRRVPRKIKRRSRGEFEPETNVPRRRLKIEYVRVETLKEWDRNPRENEEAADKLTTLFAEYGFINPIIATRKDRVVRAGHTRLKAAVRSGMKEVPVIFVDFDSEAQAELFSIADNKSHEWSRWADALLRDILGEMPQAVELDIAIATGFSAVELEGLSFGGPQVPPGRKVPKKRKRGEPLPGAVRAELWLYFVAPDKETYKAILEEFGEEDAQGVGEKRKLAWDKLRWFFVGTKFKGVNEDEA